jgi:hypothetical protein
MLQKSERGHLLLQRTGRGQRLLQRTEGGHHLLQREQIVITACSELVTAHREEETMAHQHRLQDDDTACQEDHLGMLKPECHGTIIRTGLRKTGQSVFSQNQILLLILTGAHRVAREHMR